MKEFLCCRFRVIGVGGMVWLEFSLDDGGGVFYIIRVVILRL